jgi:hypothetical protein
MGAGGHGDARAATDVNLYDLAAWCKQTFKVLVADIRSELLRKISICLEG